MARHLGEIEKVTIELQEAITEKLRLILGEEGVEILTEYVWHMLVNPRRSQYHLVQELQEFLADETEAFVHWILTNVAPKVDAKVLASSLAAPRDAYAANQQRPPGLQSPANHQDSKLPLKDPEPKFEQRRQRYERRERILDLAVQQATHQADAARTRHPAKVMPKVGPDTEDSTAMEDVHQQFPQPISQRGSDVWRSYHSRGGRRRHRSRSADRKSRPHNPDLPPQDDPSYVDTGGFFRKRLGLKTLPPSLPMEAGPHLGFIPPPAPSYMAAQRPIIPPFPGGYHPAAQPPSFPPPYVPQSIPLDLLKEAASSQGFALRPIGSQPKSKVTEEVLNVTATHQEFKKKCTKWPDCPDGEACLYVHPSEMCNNWPHCQYGASCFYIHPQMPCKFGLNCHNANCNYVHPTGWNPAANVS